MASLKNKIQASNKYKVNEVVQSLTATKDEETTEYALATDSNHVTMSTGYNLEESFNALANTMSEEFVSEDGSEITVENCIDKTRILKLGIEGRTVKNITPVGSGGGVWDGNLYTYTENGKYKRFTRTTDTKIGACGYYSVVSTEIIKPSTMYTVVLNVTNLTNETHAVVKLISPTMSNSCPIILKLGLNTVLVTSLDDVVTDKSKACVYLSNAENLNQEEGAIIEFDYIGLMKGDVATTVTQPIPFGLSSTQATLNVNGIKHSFYDQNGEVIELHKTGDVCDSLVQNVDGSLELTRRVDITGEEYTVLATPITTHIDKKYNSGIPITSSENTISIGEGVQASEFSVSVPTNKISKLEEQVEALQNAVLLLNS